ncbi:zinc finger BED domain-containing protein DAYSLEEPER isoform X1 [Lathyrus oleraceus]|uniref:zinc finger BED domain-containing protein DAYSLEEPER isoform X1 n=2 Tax=Pisum sativum TaxID=3888 RepID=UPI0021D14C72|nr:zinc finger BED domain-containing protein DAYSLEEPER-like isoform X1 [Pisum sativum]
MEFQTCIITPIINNEKPDSEIITPIINNEKPDSEIITPIINDENPDSGTQPNKRKKKKSIVWDYFTVEPVVAGCARAYCKQCKKSFSYITNLKVAGTSNLKKHISLGICQVMQQKSQPNPHSVNGVNGGLQINGILPNSYPVNGGLQVNGMLPNSHPVNGGLQVNGILPKKRQRATPTYAGKGVSFDQERCNNDIAKMVILHDYPLDIVEQPGFIAFAQTLQPQFNPLCLNSFEGYCVSMYLREKQNLLDLINGIPGRLNLTLDVWSSNQTTGYVIIRGHFIDSDSNLHHPILNVVTVPFLDSDELINQSIMTCLSDWHLEGRVLTLALDKSFSSETVKVNLRSHLSINNPVILSGQLLNRNCYARVLSRIAVDALQAMRETISKVREYVKFVKHSESHEEKFIELKQQLQVPSLVNLLIDDHYKWDTTYHMLVAAWELKEVFACLDTRCPDFAMTLTMDDWKQIKTLCTYLKHLYDASYILTTQPYPTANLFFAEVSKLHMELTIAAFSQDLFLSSLILPLLQNFDQYWRDSCLILAVAVAMDPRHKMKLVETTFAKIFGENAEPWIRIVEDGLHELFIEYNTEMLHFTATNGGGEGDEIMLTVEPYEGPVDGSLFVDEGELSDFEFCISDMACLQPFKSELDEYLEEPQLSEATEFNILNWWRLNQSKYPTLSRMASDILSMSISTVSPDSVFDTGVRKMDNHRSLLESHTLDALICAKDWLQHKSLPKNVSNI